MSLSTCRSSPIEHLQQEPEKAEPEQLLRKSAFRPFMSEAEAFPVGQQDHFLGVSKKSSISRP
jgi:hypothetical protein